MHQEVIDRTGGYTPGSRPEREKRSFHRSIQNLAVMYGHGAFDGARRHGDAARRFPRSLASTVHAGKGILENAPLQPAPQKRNKREPGGLDATDVQRATRAEHSRRSCFRTPRELSVTSV